jgi:aminomethyltransferase
VLCREDGGVLDDCFTYRLGSERYLTVTNAANHEQDLAWFVGHRDGLDVEIINRAQDYAMLAVQGPLARELVQAIASAPLPPRMTVAERTINGVDALVCGTGYTGEDGVELLIPTAEAPAVWDALVRRGAHPAGLAARDTLRSEVCYHLYGNDLSTEHGPIEAGLGWCCKEDTGFIGSEAVRAARQTPPAERLVAFKLTDRGVARPGDPIRGGGQVTSGTFSPSLEVGIGMAYLPTAASALDSEFEIDVRGKIRRARVAARPLYVRG